MGPRTSRARTARLPFSRLDPIRVVEASYRGDAPSDARWLQDVMEAFGPGIAFDQGYAAWLFRQDPSGWPIQTWGHVGTAPEGWIELAKSAAASGHPQVVRDYARVVPGTLRESLGDDVDSVFDADRDENEAYAQLQDNVGILGTDAEGYGVGVATAASARIVLADHERTTLMRLGAHLRAGYRLRRRLEAGGGATEAVFALSGELVHAEGEARAAEARGALRSAVQAIDAARRRRRRSDRGDLLERWRALVAGRWSLVEQFESDGRCFLVARRNDAQLPATPRLTAREAQIVAHAALGHPDKVTAYELGISESTVGAYVSRARRKLRARSRVELVWRLAAEHGRTPRRAGGVQLFLGGADYVALSGAAPAALAVLSPALRGVAWAALGGHPNAQIARARGVSARTIANQLAAVYQKLGVSSRAQLAARLFAPPGK